MSVKRKAAAILLAVGVLAAGTVEAQVIRGQLVARGRGLPLAGAFIIVTDSGGADVQRVLTGPDGSFTVELTQPGRYRLRTAMIGWQSWTSPQLVLASDETLQYRMEVPLRAVALQAVVVEGDRRCHTRPDSGLAVARVWEEARKALSALAWSQQQAVHHYRLERYQRRLDARSLAIRDERRTAARGYARGSPFVSAPAEELSAEGYIQRTAGGDWDYFAPDASVLLSDTFAGDHCFFITTDEERVDRIGLGFRPTRDREHPDVQGILWLDRQSGELRHLDYRYARLPWPLDTPEAGGRVEFARLPSGTWIVQHWSIRMPLLERRGHELSVRAFTEVGGDVTEVRSATGGPLRRQARAGLAGSVVDSTTLEPLRNATVLLLGTTHVTRADTMGRFEFAELPPGVYRATFEHPAVDAAGYPPTPLEVTVSQGAVARVVLALPPTSRMRQQLCPALAGGDTLAIVTGFVRWGETGMAASDAIVSLSWERVVALRRAGRVTTDVERIRFDVATDTAGYYRACGVPADHVIRVEAQAVDARTDPVELRLAPQEIARRDLDLPGPKHEGPDR